MLYVYTHFKTNDKFIYTHLLQKFYEVNELKIDFVGDRTFDDLKRNEAHRVSCMTQKLIVTKVCLYYVMTNKYALHEDLEEIYKYFLRVYNIADNKQHK